MFWTGSLESAYNSASMIKMQMQFSGINNFSPWTYPPQFDLIAALLALAPEGLAYFIFTTLTFIFYVCILRFLAREYFDIAILAIAPALFVSIKGGQNGFLTGALVGLFCLTFIRDRLRAGLPLGFMVIKPHLAVGMAVLALVNKRWGVLAMAALVVGLTSLLATVVFGYHIWPAFIGGVGESAQFLKEGRYPFYRMTSVYALCMTFDLSPGHALLIQIIAALTACCVIYYACAKGWRSEHMLGIAVLSSLFISPYIYDYDLPIFGIAIALLMPSIIANASQPEKVILLGCSWTACGWGLRHRFAHDNIWSVSGICLLVIYFMVLRIVSAAERSRTKEIPPLADEPAIQ